MKLRLKLVILDGKQIQELLDQVRQRATAAEEALEASEERAEKYRAIIDEANVELNQFKDKQQKTESQIELNSAEAEQVKAQLEELKISLSTLEAQNAELLSEKVLLNFNGGKVYWLQRDYYHL